MLNLTDSNYLDDLYDQWANFCDTLRCAACALRDKNRTFVDRTHQLDIDLSFSAGKTIRAAMERRLKTGNRDAHVAWWARMFGEPLRGARVSIHHEYTNTSDADTYIADVIVRALAEHVVCISVESVGALIGVADAPQEAAVPTDGMRALLPRLERFTALFDSYNLDAGARGASSANDWNDSVAHVATYDLLRADAAGSHARAGSDE